MILSRPIARREIQLIDRWNLVGLDVQEVIDSRLQRGREIAERNPTAVVDDSGRVTESQTLENVADGIRQFNRHAVVCRQAGDRQRVGRSRHRREAELEPVHIGRAVDCQAGYSAVAADRAADFGREVERIRL